MSLYPRVHIYNDSKDNIRPTHVEINGKLIKGVRSIRYDSAVDRIPTLTLELVSLMDSGIDINSPEITIKVHPQTLREALNILGMAGVQIGDGDDPVCFIDDGK